MQVDQGLHWQTPFCPSPKLENAVGTDFYSILVGTRATNLSKEGMAIGIGGFNIQFSDIDIWTATLDT